MTYTGTIEHLLRDQNKTLDRIANALEKLVDQNAVTTGEREYQVTP